MLLAELTVRHTRRHMPTRRVAIDHAYLPVGGPAPGAALAGAVAAEVVLALDDEDREVVPKLLEDTARGLRVPGIALRHRLQTDTHGLDRSRHRILGERGRTVVELDVHGAPVPQLLGVLLGAATMPVEPRGTVLRAVRAACDGWFALPPRWVVRRLVDGIPVARPGVPGATWVRGGPPGEDRWAGFTPDHRWAMEVLGISATLTVTRDEVSRRFRRLLREAHPDHGGARAGAAERISELRAARELLLVRIGGIAEAGADEAADPYADPFASTGR